MSNSWLVEDSLIWYYIVCLLAKSTKFWYHNQSRLDQRFGRTLIKKKHHEGGFLQNILHKNLLSPFPLRDVQEFFSKSVGRGSVTMCYNRNYDDNNISLMVNHLNVGDPKYTNVYKYLLIYIYI